MEPRRLPGPLSVTALPVEVSHVKAYRYELKTGVAGARLSHLGTANRRSVLPHRGPNRLAPPRSIQNGQNGERLNNPYHAFLWGNQDKNEIVEIWAW